MREAGHALGQRVPDERGFRFAPACRRSGDAADRHARFDDDSRLVDGEDDRDTAEGRRAGAYSDLGEAAQRTARCGQADAKLGDEFSGGEHRPVRPEEEVGGRDLALPGALTQHEMRIERYHRHGKLAVRARPDQVPDQRAAIADRGRPDGPQRLHKQRNGFRRFCRHHGRERGAGTDHQPIPVARDATNAEPRWCPEEDSNLPGLR